MVVSAQHIEAISNDDLREAILKEVIQHTLPAELLDRNTSIFINTTGRFVIGGPMGDCGLTGRKIIQDTYGGSGCTRRRGGSPGKDPSKVDRSGAYMARYIAKNIVAAGLADICEVQVAYCIGVADPVSVLASSRGTGQCDDQTLTKAVKEVFDLRPLPCHPSPGPAAPHLSQVHQLRALRPRTSRIQLGKDGRRPPTCAQPASCKKECLRWSGGSSPGHRRFVPKKNLRPGTAFRPEVFL